MKRKLLTNIIIGIASFILLIIFTIVDKFNKLGFLSRLTNSEVKIGDSEESLSYSSSKIIGIMMALLILLFAFALVKGIFAYIRNDIDKMEKPLDFLNTTNIIPLTISVFMIIDSIFFSPVIVSGRSMMDTLHDGDYLMVNHYTKSFHDGDIVIIEKTENYFIVKRVVAEEGDVLNVDKDGVVTVNGVVIEENKYTDKVTEYYNYTLKENEIYCLGDNRGNSTDSRRYGVFTLDKVIGKVSFSIKPFKLNLEAN